jgi:hypothetical protein
VNGDWDSPALTGKSRGFGHRMGTRAYPCWLGPPSTSLTMRAYGASPQRPSFGLFPCTDSGGHGRRGFDVIGGPATSTTATPPRACAASATGTPLEPGLAQGSYPGSAPPARSRTVA